MLYTVWKVTSEYESCSLCLKLIRRGKFCAISEKGKAAHYGCAKDRGWKRKSRAKSSKQKLEFAPVNRPIKIWKSHKTNAATLQADGIEYSFYNMVDELMDCNPFKRGEGSR